MDNEQLQNPLHGETLESILQYLVDHYGWQELGLRIKSRSVTRKPGKQARLKFLRKMPWARPKVEDLYLRKH
jgi:uncharacterized protein (DUF2132 family)